MPFLKPGGSGLATVGPFEVNADGSYGYGLVWIPGENAVILQVRVRVDSWCFYKKKTLGVGSLHLHVTVTSAEQRPSRTGETRYFVGTAAAIFQAMHK